jgi:uncharacterized protein (TIGR00159 family)
MGEHGFTTYLDVALVAAALFAVITWLKRARAGLAVVGGLLLVAIYLTAIELRLQLTAWVFRGAFAAFVIVLIVVLQNDLRRLFERVASIGAGSRAARHGDADALEVVSETAFELADRRCGALIVISGKDAVERYVDGGERLDGRISRALLLSLFDPGSVGHDGAVILDGSTVTRFAVHLPLSANFRQIRSRGTRHAAAAGLSEVTDALCICVSEERGEVSIARDSQLQLVGSSEDLLAALQRFLGDRLPAGSTAQRVGKAVRNSWVNATLAVLLAIGLWQLFVSGSEFSRKTVTAPVLVEDIDPEFKLETVEPAQIKVELSGLRRDLYLLDPRAVEVRIDASSLTTGRRVFQVSRSDVRHPPDLTVEAVIPAKVVLNVRPAEKQRPG